MKQTLDLKSKTKSKVKVNTKSKSFWIDPNNSVFNLGDENYRMLWARRSTFGGFYFAVCVLRSSVLEFTALPLSSPFSDPVLLRWLLTDNSKLSHIHRNDFAKIVAFLS